MAALRADRTSFVIAHRLSTIRDADTILVMEDGRIVEQGDHDELLARRGAYSRLYNAQFTAPLVDDDEQLAAAASTVVAAGGGD
jgi:ATP-binding cassette subfamily B protein